MAIRSNPVFPAHFSFLGSRASYPTAPAAHRQEGANDYHPFCPSRPDHDEILQVFSGQPFGVLLRWYGSLAVVFGLHQELHGWDRHQYHLEQFP